MVVEDIFETKTTKEQVRILLYSLGDGSRFAFWISWCFLDFHFWDASSNLDWFGVCIWIFAQLDLEEKIALCQAMSMTQSLWTHFYRYWICCGASNQTLIGLGDKPDLSWMPNSVHIFDIIFTGWILPGLNLVTLVLFILAPSS